MKTIHHEWLTDHTAAILEEIPVMVYDASRSLRTQLVALFHCNVWLGLISLQRVAGPVPALIYDGMQCL